MAPWSGFWEHNLFVELMPMLGPIVENPVARGLVTGVGVTTVIAGLGELAGVLAARHQNAPPPQAGS